MSNNPNAPTAAPICDCISYRGSSISQLWDGTHHPNCPSFAPTADAAKCPNIRCVSGWHVHDDWKASRTPCMECKTRPTPEYHESPREDAERPQAAGGLGQRAWYYCKQRPNEKITSRHLADFAARETSRQLATLEAERDAYKAMAEQYESLLSQSGDVTVALGFNRKIERIFGKWSAADGGLYLGEDVDGSFKRKDFPNILDAFAALTAGTNEESK